MSSVTPEIHETLGRGQVADLAARRAYERAWRQFAQHQSTEEFCASWLLIQCHNVGGVSDGDKGQRLKRLCESFGVPLSAVVYLGDDVNDLPAIHLAAASCCPSDARPEVRAVVTHVMHAPGGHGAFREAVDLVLDHLGAPLTTPPSIELA